MFNEVSITLCSYSLIIYSEFTNGPEEKFIMGWPHIIIISLCVNVNMSNLIINLVSMLIRKLKRTIRKRKHDKQVKKLTVNQKKY